MLIQAVCGVLQVPHAGQYFDAAWTNAHGRQITVDYAKYADESKVKYWLYRFMEWSGLSTF